MSPALGFQTILFSKLFYRLGELNSAFSHVVTRVRLGARGVEPTSVHFLGTLNANTTSSHSYGPRKYFCPQPRVIFIFAWPNPQNMLSN